MHYCGCSKIKEKTMTEEKKVETQNEAENLLNEYNEQAENEGSHFYSEVWHSDYSDSSCCC